MPPGRDAAITFFLIIRSMLSPLRRSSSADRCGNPPLDGRFPLLMLLGCEEVATAEDSAGLTRPPLDAVGRASWLAIRA